MGMATEGRPPAGMPEAKHCFGEEEPSPPAEEAMALGPEPYRARVDCKAVQRFPLVVRSGTRADKRMALAREVSGSLEFSKSKARANPR